MRLRHSLLFSGMTLLFVATALLFIPATTSNAAALELPRPAANPQNDACLACHQNPAFTVNLPSGEAYALFVDADAFGHSIHGESGLSCVTCHLGFEPTFGHDFNPASRREATLRLNQTCGQCHEKQSDLENDSVHSAARERGNLEAATCSDCHAAHTTKRIKDKSSGQTLPQAHLEIPQTCAKCHSAVYEVYSKSVHGSALLNEKNPDVPTCIDCHGVHTIPDPTTSTFRLKSPELCAKCHANPAMMDKYGISTEVLNTYVADFHGTTIAIFEQVSPDAPTDKPVCYDCHGIHDIVRADDPQKGLSVRENLLVRCQVCHPGASPNFPDAWMSHYIPSMEKYPIVFYIDLFYKFLIPAVLLPMGILVTMDFIRLLINNFHRSHPSGPHPEALEELEAELDAAEEEAQAQETAEAAQKAPAPPPEEPAPPTPEETKLPSPEENAKTTDEETQP